jgi:hypothetical protein
MPSAQQEIASLKRKLSWTKKGKSFAWAKYFEEERHSNDEAIKYHDKLKSITEQAQDGIPTHIKTELIEMTAELKKKIECPICLEIIGTDEMDITRCGHKYHKNCIEQVSNNKCPTCRKKLKYNTD